MLPAVALSLALLEVSGASTRYAVGARVDSRVRSHEVATEDAPSIAGDTDVVPTLGLDFRDGNTTLMVEYAPRISLREVTVRPRTEVQHTGRLGGVWRPERGLSLRLTEELVLGQVNLFTTDLTPAPIDEPSEPGGPLAPGPVQPLPDGVDTVYFLSSTTMLSADTSWLGRRWQLAGSAGFNISGGLDGPAREAVPLQYGPRFDASLTRVLTRLSALTTTLSATNSRFSTGADATVVTLAESWAQRIDRRTSLEAGAGMALVRAVEAPSEAEPAPEAVLGALPYLTLGAGHRIPSRTADFNARAGLRLTPFVDRLTGRVYPRADLTLTGTWAFGPRVRVSPNAGAAFAVGGASGDSIVSGGMGASWTLTRWVTVDADVRSTWSRSPDVEAARFSWAAVLGLSVRQAGIL